jgi:hypothetical protein
MFHPPPAIIVAVGRRFPQGVLCEKSVPSRPQACAHRRLGRARLPRGDGGECVDDARVEVRAGTPEYGRAIDDFYVDPLLSKR